MKDRKEIEEQNTKERMLSLSSSKKPQEVVTTSINDKILKSRAIIENKKEVVQKQVPKTVTDKQVLSTKTVEVVSNPFLKKENKNLANRKKNVFEDLIQKTVQKKAAPVEPVVKSGTKQSKLNLNSKAK